VLEKNVPIITQNIRENQFLSRNLTNVYDVITEIRARYNNISPKYLRSFHETRIEFIVSTSNVFSPPRIRKRRTRRPWNNVVSSTNVFARREELARFNAIVFAVTIRPADISDDTRERLAVVFNNNNFRSFRLRIRGK